MKLRKSILLAAALTSLTAGANGAVLLTDNFNGVDLGEDTYNINYDLASRQTGSQETQSWSKTNNVQIGNEGTFGPGQYLQVANENGYTTLAGLSLSSSLIASNEKLVISFTTDVINEILPAIADDWLAFTVGDGLNNGWPVAGEGEFGFLLRANGGMQAFSNSPSGLTMVGPTFATSDSVVNLTFTFSGADGTGSAFAGNGSKVEISDGTSTWSSVLSGNLSAETIGFRTQANGIRGMVDNLSISTIPEPSAALLGGLGMLALLRRRRSC